MSHYFTDNTDLKANRKEISFRFLDFTYTLTSDDGVFSKKGLDTGTEALLKVCVQEELSGKVADLGSGIGVIGVILSHFFKDLEIQGFDINPRAVALANLNYKRYHVKGMNVVADGLTGTFDYVISNPPIRIGKEHLYRLIDHVYDVLRPEGSFYFVIRKQQGAKSLQNKCQELFGNCELLQKEKGYYIYKAIKH